VLSTRLASRIAADGPIPFDEFMAACLYDEAGGYFTAGPLRSVAAGDFLTSPEVSPWFGTMLGRFALGVRRRLGRPGRFRVVEVAAGSGSLLRSLRRELPEGAQIDAIETSAAARRALRGLLGDDRVHSRMDDLPPRFDGVVIANELMDNLPVAVAVRAGSGWEERWVGHDADGFHLVAAPCRPAVARWCDRHAGVVPDDGIVEVQLAAGEWLRAALGRLGRGAVVVIDYGGTAEELAGRRAEGTLRTYRGHHLGPDPLLEPGANDITVDVDFGALVAVAEDAGAVTELTTQAAFLEDLGLRDEIERLRRRERELAASGETMGRLQVRSEATDAETLLHPRGLGDFRVLVARKG